MCGGLCCKCVDVRGRRMLMPSSRLRVLNLGEALNLASHNFSSMRRLMTSWGIRWRTATLKVCPSILKWMATGMSSLFLRRARQLRRRTQPGLSPVPEQTGKLVPLTPFYSINAPVVQFFGRSSCLLWLLVFVYNSPNLFCGPSGSVQTRLTGVRSKPGPRTHLPSLLREKRKHHQTLSFFFSFFRTRASEFSSYQKWVWSLIEESKWGEITVRTKKLYLLWNKVRLKRIVRIFANNQISLNRTNIFCGSNHSGSALFIFSGSYRNFATSHTAPRPRARWPLDRDRRNDSNRPTQPGGLYRLPVILKAVLFLLFWLMKENERRPIKIDGTQV